MSFMAMVQRRMPMLLAPRIPASPSRTGGLFDRNDDKSTNWSIIPESRITPFLQPNFSPVP